ncbi:MAG: hypothetical protein A2X84_11000 [Desulfuromonadaceae bacterium GWC2_58_13]|nr:MAG: hypothetical protein A2X84_11000 [Desulfuromonadaceae bacterium GWC2_58_13]
MEGGDKNSRTPGLEIVDGEGAAGGYMELKNLLSEIEEKLADAVRRRFTGEIRLTFNVSQGGFSTSYIEKERENLVKKRK